MVTVVKLCPDAAVMVKGLVGSEPFAATAVGPVNRSPKPHTEFEGLVT